MNKLTLSEKLTIGGSFGFLGLILTLLAYPVGILGPVIALIFWVIILYLLFNN